jgi:hypothetical protein
MFDMKKAGVKAVLGRVLTWPEPAQEEAIASLRGIEDDYVGGGDYHATAEELEATDEADREALGRSADDVRHDRFADEDEVDAVFGRYRRA